MRDTSSSADSFRSCATYSSPDKSSSSSTYSSVKRTPRRRSQSKTISHSTRAVFRKHEDSKRGVPMDVRVDTGASMTAIPHYLMRKLGLKPLRSVRIRTGTDQTQQRDVVMVNICFLDKSYNVEATVRRGKKLGMTPILGRNFLKQDSFKIVIPPSESGSNSASEENTSCSGSDSPRSLGGASTMSTVSERSEPSAIEMKDKVWVVFKKKATSKERVRMQVRVDTGASMTAIPVALARKLGLRSHGRVRVRLGTDAVDVRDVVYVNVTYEGKSYDVKASVRDGSKLGKTAILGRNLLNQDNFVVRVSDR